MKTISLPTHINDNFGDSMGKLFELQVQIDNTEKDIEILLDYSKASFTKPFFTLGLLLLIKQYEGKRAPINLQSEIENQSVAGYMSNISFPHIIHCDKTNSDSVKSLLEKYKNKTYIPLLSFPIGSDDETSRIRDIFIGHLNSLLRGFVNVGTNYNLLSALLYLIDETIENIIHHAYRDNGYIFAQFYPTLGYLDICIGDIGRTLLESYTDFKDNAYNVTNHLEAMKAALQGKSTKLQDISRGFGISTSTRMLTEGMNGKYFIYSGDTFCYISAEKNEIYNTKGDFNWQGVLVCLRIPALVPQDFDYYKFAE